MIQTRQAQLHDRDRVRDIHLAAFPDAERKAVAELAVNLLAEQKTTETFALVAEADGNLIGHVVFSPVMCVDTGNDLGYILAPLAVHPTYQKRGIGTNLIEAGIKRLSDLGVSIVFVYGDPNYYGRFGFDADLATEYVPPYQLQYEFGWQAKRLTDIQGLPSPGKLTCVDSLMEPQLW
ncbi:N-acetyltransferase [filamentous cyanobacterium LEGE 11480]|uniref:N-acetyltransferase n=1 Tax=Romeriopsis navalis LEGE 11480 TaxID=2777977 RepID=A0A928VNA1_9CYAN|nr:N-acetyltransferase [Romeriopsis navalis]MBE9029831.1 N-acetyltransferase [Romeriopsis navalis LEGE 11480]